MHDDKTDNIFDKDDAPDFIIYEEIETHGQERNGGKGGCLRCCSATVVTGGECDASELEMIDHPLCLSSSLLSYHYFVIKR